MSDIEQVEMLITDSSADPEELERLRAAGVQVVLADQE
jgi:DeoR family transcriptional regulator of aga operon